MIAGMGGQPALDPRLFVGSVVVDYQVVACLDTSKLLAIENGKGYQIPGSAQRLLCEPRQAGNGATVAIAACVAGKSGVWPRLVNGQ